MAGNILEFIFLDMFFIVMVICLNVVDVGEFEVVLNFLFEDLGQIFVIEVFNGVMCYYECLVWEGVDVMVNLMCDFWFCLIQ